MHPRIEELLTYLDTQRTALARAVEAVPPDERDQRLAPDRWSVGEVVAHLAAVESQISRLLAARIASARAKGVGPETSTTSVLSTLDTSRLLDRSNALLASEATQPPAGVNAEGAWRDLSARREELRAVIIDADGLALEQLGATNPVIGPLNGYQWVLFVGAHEARHTRQVDEVAAALAARRST